ncbi:hypothetical protein ATK36_4022 [Amycolatopsis sulphurea]|uniref:Uncharacterized protein n=1 Tax=Amycolatopsis sulphurea TaxID=76022 RepID=A0A2A9FC15_9PSEU|nr:hypothetical protein ATK36_4022 [Amycolatopsis sulphurea]
MISSESRGCRVIIDDTRQTCPGSVKGPFTDSESVKGPFTDLRSLRPLTPTLPTPREHPPVKGPFTTGHGITR